MVYAVIYIPSIISFYSMSLETVKKNHISISLLYLICTSCNNLITSILFHERGGGVTIEPFKRERMKLCYVLHKEMP